VLVSIRRRLLILLLLIISLVGGITLARSYLASTHEIEEVFDAELAQSARSLQAIVLHNLKSIDYYAAQTLLDYDPGPDIKKNRRAGHSYERKLAFQVWDAPERLILHSSSAPITPLSPDSMTPEHRGFTDVVIEGVDWRVFSLWDHNNRYLIQIGEHRAIRNELVNKIVMQLFAPSFISIPVLALLIWFAIGRGLSPISRVVNEVIRREPDYLKSINIKSIPEEIYPLVQELNALFLRLEDAFIKERRFTDDAAHELRTPLAALKTQVQVALRAQNDEERDMALSHMLEGVDRATHLVHQMLTLARLGNADSQKNIKTIELHNFVQEVMAQLAPGALEKNIELTFSGDNKAYIKAQSTSLQILLGNIIDNAIKYSPRQGDITVMLTHHEAHIVLSIDDSGPGIQAEFQQQIFERYFRILGTKVDGCGLGLAIAQQCAERLNATIKIENSSQNGGLNVKIYFLAIADEKPIGGETHSDSATRRHRPQQQ